jgi:hypothetical protein
MSRENDFKMNDFYWSTLFVFVDLNLDCRKTRENPPLFHSTLFVGDQHVRNRWRRSCPSMAAVECVWEIDDRDTIECLYLSTWFEIWGASWWSPQSRGIWRSSTLTTGTKGGPLWSCYVVQGPGMQVRTTGVCHILLLRLVWLSNQAKQ